MTDLEMSRFVTLECKFNSKRGQILEEVCGTLEYIAPGFSAGKPYDGLAIDIWSLGVVLYVLVTGKYPYVETTYDSMHRLITNTKFPIPYHLSKPSQQVIA